jgi:hypothetical protein
VKTVKQRIFFVFLTLLLDDALIILLSCFLLPLLSLDVTTEEVSLYAGAIGEALLRGAVVETVGDDVGVLPLAPFSDLVFCGVTMGALLLLLIELLGRLLE